MARLRTLTDKRCVVTGAASGIGRALALAGAAERARLVLTDRDATGLDETVALVAAAGGRVDLASAGDITDPDHVAAFAEAALAQGQVHVVANVAGISTWGPIDRLSLEDWRACNEVNLMGPISVLHAFVPSMIAAGQGGHIVNVSSAAGLLGLPWHAAYSASKFGLRGVSEVLRFDLAPHGIGVSLVCPGAVATPLVQSVRIVGVDRERPDLQQAVARFQRHAVTPEHVAACIVSGVKRNRYLVTTSLDIRAGHLLERVFPPGYRLVMTGANRYFARVARRNGYAPVGS